MSFTDSAKHVLATVAPMLATATLGPFAPIANAAIAAIFGTTPADTAATAAALAAATPDQLLALKKAEEDFQIQMQQLGISEEKLTFDDIASARSREIAVKDRTPAYLAYAVTIGFFGTLGFMLVNGKPATGGDALLVMLGALGGAWGSIVSYYYGSSKSSDSKTQALTEIAKK